MPAPVRQASGRQHFAVAGHAQHRAGHGIEHALLVRVGDDDRGRDRPAAPARSRNPSPCRWPAPCGWFRISSTWWWWRYRLRDQRAVDDAALAGAGTVAAGKRLQQPRGAALGGGRKRVVADFDGPGALADRDARQRRLVMRLQPPLRGGRLRRERRQRPAHRPRPSASGGEMARVVVTKRQVLGSARACCHLGRNIRQTTRLRKIRLRTAWRHPRSAGKVLAQCNP